jgi:hypothetical protein
MCPHSSSTTQPQIGYGYVKDVIRIIHKPEAQFMTSYSGMEYQLYHGRIGKMEQGQWKFDVKHVINARCPTCGTEAVMVKLSHRYGSVRYHSNGKRQETVEYACGFKVYYNPNLDEEEITVKCPHSPEEKERLADSRKSYETLYDSIKNMGLTKQNCIRILKETNCALGYPFRYDDPEKRFPDEDFGSGKD